MTIGAALVIGEVSVIGMVRLFGRFRSSHWVGNGRWIGLVVGALCFVEAVSVVEASVIRGGFGPWNGRVRWSRYGYLCLLYGHGCWALLNCLAVSVIGAIPAIGVV